MTEVEEIIFWWRLQGCLFAQVRLWKWRRTDYFVKNSAYFVLKIEFLLIVLSNFKRKAAIKDSAFSWVACFLTHKILWSVNSLIINLISLACHMVWYIQYLWWYPILLHIFLHLDWLRTKTSPNTDAFYSV